MTAGLAGRFATPDDLRSDANVFTIIRGILASAVIYTHAYGLTGAGHDPTNAFLPFPISRLAVLLFFSLSGLMITGSFVRRGAVSFVLARGLRILPGLWVMLALTTLVLGFGLSTVPPGDFFTPANLGGYVGRNALLIGSGDYRLAGVFATNPLNTVNQSLWSIPQEIKCYLTIVVAGLAGLLGRRKLFLAGFVALVVLDLTPLGARIAFVPLAVSFYAGVAMFLWIDRLWLSWPLAAAVIATGLLLGHGEAARLVVQLGFAYTAVVAAILLPTAWKRRGSRMPDYSYGIYIYAFPVQQAVVALGWGTTPALNLLVTIALVAPLAVVSWHFVEQPALALKSRLMRGSATRVARDQPA